MNKEERVKRAIEALNDLFDGLDSGRYHAEDFGDLLPRLRRALGIPSKV